MRDIKELHNIHAGRRCFILGNGPSLNKVDFGKLQNEIVFGVNSIFLLTRTNGFRPTYFVVEDNLVFKDNKDDIDAYEGVTKILPLQYAKQLECKDECFVFDMEQSFYNKNSRNYSLPQFNTSSQPTFHCGQSVTYINMQLAYYMGFQQVVLLGMDFSYAIPADHQQQGNHIHSQGDDPNHFHKDYFGKGKTWKDPRLGRVLRSYHQAKFSYESAGRSIVNGTEAGKLELFDRVSFDSLFSPGAQQ